MTAGRKFWNVPPTTLYNSSRDEYTLTSQGYRMTAYL